MVNNLIVMQFQSEQILHKAAEEIPFVLKVASHPDEATTMLPYMSRILINLIALVMPSFLAMELRICIRGQWPLMKNGPY